MSWIQKLYETYENCQSMVGVVNGENKVPLLPICHNTQQAQIEIVIDQDGNFKRARVVSKVDARTIIPCTESSGGRTSGEAPHPLCDKLQYVAADYEKYGGDKAHYFASYRDELSRWCESEYGHIKAKAVLKYVQKGKVIEDLVNYKVLYLSPDKKILKTWEKVTKENTPDIFKVSGSMGPADSFVRWIVEAHGEENVIVWTDLSLYESWIKYYLSTRGNLALCYVQGKETLVADQHPRNIRRDGDSAKLMSSGISKNKNGTEKVNDKAGFTFLGRFSNPKQACNVSIDVSHKAHNVLRWLINRQSYKRDSQVIVAWATSGDEIPDPLADPFSLLGLDTEQFNSESSLSSVSTAQDFALKLNKKIAGYSTTLDNTSEVVVMGLDSATPGRMAITYYRELTESDFLSKLDYWHRTCCWIHDYRTKELVEAKTGKKKRIAVRFVGAPAPNDIAEAAYGNKVDDKLRKTTVERILPCIIDEQKIPRDLVESTVRRASNRVGMKDFEWNKTLSIACALYKKYREKEDFNMVLDTNRKTRDYLYGRLLALADSMEQWALKKAGENRQTTAARLMQRFSDHPFSTWRTIELSLNPYKARLGGASINMQSKISEVVAMFDPEEFISDKSLSGEFLLGYHCQREALWDKGNKAKDNDLGNLD